jgi:SAM-dependent methyltransferase
VTRLYGDLAPWFHLLTRPEDYATEATRYRDLVLREVPDARTLLELGCGGGNNALHLKGTFACTLTDLSPQMLGVSRALNPQCEHVLGDMRTLRLGRTFDAVFAHDAVMYMTTELDLAATIATAFAHTRPGGVALFVPDATRETHPGDGFGTGGHDDEESGRRLRYLEWSHDPDPTDTAYDVDFAILLHEPGRPARVVHDHHELGLFPVHTWLHLLERAGFDASVDHGLDDGRPQPVLVGRRPA